MGISINNSIYFSDCLMILVVTKTAMFRLQLVSLHQAMWKTARSACYRHFLIQNY